MDSTPKTGLSHSNVPGKLLRRFYEPLSLLSALGKARSPHTEKALISLEQIDSLTAQELRRQFLGELAFLCDYEKGGNTVTAIGLGQTPQGWQFWVAANEPPQKTILPFLVKLLSILEEHEQRDRAALTADIFKTSVTFAHSRLKTYARFLQSDLNKLMKFSSFQDSEASAAIRDWRNKLDTLVENDPHALVRFAHENRHSDFVRRLSSAAHERRYKTSRDSLEAICMSTRHHIGRLGLHARSSKGLAMYTSRVMSFLDSYTVQVVPIPINGHGRPSYGKATTVEVALRRMLSRDAPDHELYRQALSEMDEPFQISKRFLEAFSNAESKSRVHAEVQVLHHFEENGLEFVDGDKYIACSKPACFCCLLYFRHHPGGFVEPRSHYKIYMNWQPPAVRSATRPGKEHQLRDILNLMIKDIRKDALRQIIERAGPRNVHPDSVTGITVSALAVPDHDAVSTAADSDGSIGEAFNDSSDFSSFDSDHTASSSTKEEALLDVDSDSDEEGGISLVGS